MGMLLARSGILLLLLLQMACGGSRGDEDAQGAASSQKSSTSVAQTVSHSAQSLSSVAQGLSSAQASWVSVSSPASISSSENDVYFHSSSIHSSRASLSSAAAASTSGGDSGFASSVSTSVSSSASANLQISGRIQSPSGHVLDSTLNDVLAPFSFNDSLLNAQPIANLSQVQGFATSVPVGVGRFAQFANNDDFYYVRLNAGQIVRLRVVDINRDSSGQFTRGDLDLFVYSGSTLGLVGYAMSSNEYEEVYIPSDGVYYLNVKAYAGSAKYFLTLLAGKSTLASLGVMAADTAGLASPTGFAVGEALVEYQPLAAASRGGNASAARSGVTRVPIDLPQSRVAQANAAGGATGMNQAGLAQRDTLIAIKQLREQPQVRHAEPNFYRAALNAAVPQDPGFELQWHHRALKTPTAWSLLPKSPLRSVVVAVIDTGVAMDHPEFIGKLVPGFDFIRDPQSAGDGDGIDNNPDDVGASVVNGSSYFHGTHVAGLIGAAQNNDEGGAGVAPQVRLMPIRYLGKNGGTSYDLIQALRFAAGLSNDSGQTPAQTADIINLSLGSNSYSLFEQQTIDLLRERNIMVVAAAGNAGTNETMYPAGYRGVIGVGATTALNLLGAYSNYGSTIDLVAPGGDITRDSDGDGFKDGIFSSYASLNDGVRTPTYLMLQGTSMAAPQVAGVLAMMLSIHPFTPTQMDYLINNHFVSDDLGPEGRDNIFGNGLVNATKAVQIALQYHAGVQLAMPGSQVQVVPENLVMGDYAVASIRIEDRGVGEVAVQHIYPRENWLSLTPTLDVDGRGLGNYQLSVDRTGMSAGTYAGAVEIDLSDGNRLIFNVTMTVGINHSAMPGAQPWVALMSPDLSKVYALAAAAQDTEGWHYAFAGIDAGRYVIIGGSDIDADSIICVKGESCGGVGGMSSLSPLDLVDQPLTNQDFSLQLLTNTPRLLVK